MDIIGEPATKVVNAAESLAPIVRYLEKRYGFTDDERREIRAVALECMRKAKSLKGRMYAIRTCALLDNLDRSRDRDTQDRRSEDTRRTGEVISAALRTPEGRAALLARSRAAYDALEQCGEKIQSTDEHMKGVACVGEDGRGEGGEPPHISPENSIHRPPHILQENSIREPSHIFQENSIRESSAGLVEGIATDSPEFAEERQEVESASFSQIFREKIASPEDVSLPDMIKDGPRHPGKLF